jgi:argininosuccinate lyase
MSNNETGILIVPDSYASTSSAMPQKKNSVVTEIARACPGIILGNLASTICVYKALPSSYNLDLQEMTPKMSESYLLIQTTVDVMKGLIEGLKFNEKRSEKILIKNFSTAMETAEYITIKMGIPFREAHHIVGAYVRECLEKELEPISEEAYSVFLKELTPYKRNTINFKEYKSLLDPKQSVIKKTIYGGPSPSNTIKMVSGRRLNIIKYRENIRKEAERLIKASSKLDQKVSEIIGGESS